MTLLIAKGLESRRWRRGARYPAPPVNAGPGGNPPVSAISLFPPAPTVLDGSVAGSSIGSLGRTGGDGDGTWALTGDLATIAEISGTTLRLTTTASTATHDGTTGTITYTGDSAGGTAAPIAVTLGVRAPATSGYDIAAMRVAPSFPTEGITVAQIGADVTVVEDNATNFWQVTASDLPALNGLVGQQFKRLRDVVNAVNAVDCVVKLPACRVQLHADINHEMPTRLTLQGTVDGNGRPATMLRGCVSANHFQRDGASTASLLACSIWAKDIRFGVFPEDEPLLLPPNDPIAYWIPGGAFNMVFAGDLIIQNCEIVGFQRNGIALTNDRMWDRTNNVNVWLYDCRLMNNGQNGLKHNIYTHATNELRMVRCVSARPRYGHAVKMDGERLILIDCFISNGAHDFIGGNWNFDDNEAAIPAHPINTTRDTDVLIYSSVIHNASPLKGSGAFDPNPRGFFETTSRRSHWGGYGLKFPPMFQEDRAWGLSSAGEPAPTFEAYSPSPYISGLSRGVATAATALGSTTLVLKVMGYIGGNEGTGSGPELGSRYEFRLYTGGIWGYGGQVIETAGVCVDRGSTWTNKAGDKTEYTGNDVVFELDAPLPVALGAASPGVARLEGEPWYQPLFEPKIWNPADPDYYWPKIKGVDGSLDHENKQEHFYSHWLTDCMFVSSQKGWGGGGASFLLHLDNTRFLLQYGASKRPGSMPMPPMSCPAGRWDAGPDAGEFVWLADNYGNDGIMWGTDPVQSDYVHPWMTSIRNLSIATRDGGMVPLYTGEYYQDTPLPVIPGTPQKIWKLDEIGATVALADSSPVPSMTCRSAIDGAHPAGATTLTFVSASGVSVGHRLHVMFEPKAGTVPMQAATVTAVSSNDVTIDAPLARDLAGGEAVVAFVPAGTKPAWWNDGVS